MYDTYIFEGIKNNECQKNVHLSEIIRNKVSKHKFVYLASILPIKILFFMFY